MAAYRELLTLGSIPDAGPGRRPAFCSQLSVLAHQFEPFTRLERHTGEHSPQVLKPTQKTRSPRRVFFLWGRIEREARCDDLNLPCVP